MEASNERCRHCGAEPIAKLWPFCGRCGLFLVDTDKLDLSPAASISVWLKTREPVQALQ